MSTRDLPLRWGTHSGRVALGATLIVGGLVHLQAASTTNLWPLALGSAAHALGWLVLPASAWRRLLPVLPSLGTLWLLLTGPQSTWTIAITYLGWLLARRRPWLSLITVGPVLLASVVAALIWQEYSGMLPALLLTGAASIGCAWWAAALDRDVSARSRPAHPATA